MENNAEEEDNAKNFYYQAPPELVKVIISKKRYVKDFETMAVELSASGYNSAEALFNMKQLIDLSERIKI